MTQMTLEMELMIQEALRRGVTDENVVAAVMLLWPEQGAGFAQAVRERVAAVDATMRGTRARGADLVGIVRAATSAYRGQAPCMVVETADGRTITVATAEPDLVDTIHRDVWTGMKVTCRGWWQDSSTMIMQELLLPDAGNPHAVVIMGDSMCRHGWILPNRTAALRAARQWFAALLAANRLDCESDGDEARMYDQDAAGATLSDINDWYGSGGTAGGVQIVAMSVHDVTEDMIRENTAFIHDPTVRKQYENAIRAAAETVG